MELEVQDVASPHQRHPLGCQDFLCPSAVFVGVQMCREGLSYLGLSAMTTNRMEHTGSFAAKWPSLTSCCFWPALCRGLIRGTSSQKGTWLGLQGHMMALVTQSGAAGSQVDASTDTGESCPQSQSLT